MTALYSLTALNTDIVFNFNSIEDLEDFQDTIVDYDNNLGIIENKGEVVEPEDTQAYTWTPVVIKGGI